ncbi:MAG: hypothetical protein K6C69_02435 [Lachnospiraceae bacterium]|nr:hypothetical protein [Lachnospiraceae bacterium]
MIKCNSCGAGMRFDPATQRLVCDYCNNTQDIFSQTGENISEGSEAPAEYETMIYTCPNCGGDICCDSDTAVTFCNYCGSSVELEGRLVTMEAPSGVIPFQITKEQAKEAYQKRCRQALFVPKYMKEESKLEQIRGIYMPYWLYDLDMKDDVHFKGKKSYRRGDYIITDHYRLTTNVDAHYEGTSFDASSNFTDELSMSIAPYKVAMEKPFSQGYLSGFYADVADVKNKVYSQKSKEVVGDAITESLIHTKPYLQYGAGKEDGNIAKHLHIRKKRLAYFPVWFLATERQGYVSYAVINGQTGKLAADLPIDPLKYVLFSILLAVPIMLFFSLIPYAMTPIVLTVVSMILAVISWLIGMGERKGLHTRLHSLDDWGLRSVKGQDLVPNEEEQSENKKGDGLPMIGWKPWVGIIIGIILFFWGPVQDYYYYIGIVVIMLMVLWSFADIIWLHNQLTRRVPKQFARRGGDDDYARDIYAESQSEIFREESSKESGEDATNE